MPSALDIRQKSELRKNSDARISISVLSDPGNAHALLSDTPDGSVAFNFIDTLITRLSGEEILALADDPRVSEIEFIEDSLARQVVFLMSRLEQLHFYIRTGMHDVASLNLSLAPPRRLINGRPSRTAEATVRRAIEAFTLGLDLPVIVSIGNDGPEPGSANPWALAEGVIVVTAADEAGTHLWPQASSLGPNQDNVFLVAAWGENAITGRDTRFDTDEPADPKLVDRFGPERAKSLRYVTGTSFAAPQISRRLCAMHQMVAALRATLSSTHSNQFVNTPHIRAFVDYAIDRDAPQFHLRQVEKSRKYGGLSVTLPEGHKATLGQTFRELGLDLDLRMTPTTAKRFLETVARPLRDMPGAAPFVPGNGIGADLAALRLSDLIAIFADRADPRIDGWKNALASRGDPLVLPAGLAEEIETYCDTYDLIVALPLSESE